MISPSIKPQAVENRAIPDTVPFYDAMAEHYHLIFRDWDASMAHQGAVLAGLLGSPAACGPILDCACGIGTQSLALAKRGYRVDACDLSPAEVARAQKEAISRSVPLRVWTDDMRFLTRARSDHYAAILCLDNALPHLQGEEDILRALGAMRDRLRPGGRLFISLRDYAPLIKERSTTTPPQFFDDSGLRRIVFQVWDWLDDRRYTLHLHISRQVGEDGHSTEWQSHHFVGQYRALLTEEVVTLAQSIGLTEVEVLSPSRTGFYQPIVTALRPLSKDDQSGQTP
ncbi:class I SAM-dependent methyltransferase [Rhodospirillum rubrum]|uniref:class I SAM-dependent methyltransferase n=1 Tax=Rhodospirillum rubrum TaxID=1085 RepID=UPI0019033CA0|nr:class I SAM-dependent methyltransferase [Rhodospirillum rubrum]